MTTLATRNVACITNGWIIRTWYRSDRSKKDATKGLRKRREEIWISNEFPQDQNWILASKQTTRNLTDVRGKQTASLGAKRQPCDDVIDARKHCHLRHSTSCHVYRKKTAARMMKWKHLRPGSRTWAGELLLVFQVGRPNARRAQRLSAVHHHCIRRRNWIDKGLLFAGMHRKRQWDGRTRSLAFPNHFFFDPGTVDGMRLKGFLGWTFINTGTDSLSLFRLFHDDTVTIFFSKIENLS